MISACRLPASREVRTRGAQPNTLATFMPSSLRPLVQQNDLTAGLIADESFLLGNVYHQCRILPGEMRQDVLNHTYVGKVKYLPVGHESA